MHNAAFVLQVFLAKLAIFEIILRSQVWVVMLHVCYSVVMLPSTYCTSRFVAQCKLPRLACWHSPARSSCGAFPSRGSREAERWERETWKFFCNLLCCKVVSGLTESRTRCLHRTVTVIFGTRQQRMPILQYSSVSSARIWCIHDCSGLGSEGSWWGSGFGNIQCSRVTKVQKFVFELLPSMCLKSPCAFIFQLHCSSTKHNKQIFKEIKRN